MGLTSRQLVILAGGKGTRLASQLGDNPKPMALVDGKPMLAHQIELARQYHFREILLLTGYRSEKILDYFKDGSAWGVRIHHLIESDPLGTAGALLSAFDQLAERFVVLYGDTVLSVDLDQMWKVHATRGAEFTILVHPNDHPADSDLVETDQDGWVTGLHPYPHAPGRFYPNLVNAALYVAERKTLTPWIGQAVKRDIAKHLIPELLSKGGRVHGYRSREYIKDAGTPERLAKVEVDLRSGKVAARRRDQPMRAVFLDRDGTLNREVSRISRHEDLELLAGVGAAVRRLNRAGWLVAVVTNQPVIARGDCTEADLRQIHNKLETLLGQEGAFLDGLYYCPHHPHKGFPGERPDLKIECDCRKPKTGLLKAAQADLNIDMSRSCLIGDSTVDIRCAREAKLPAVLLRSGHAGQDGTYPDQPDFTFDDLAQAVEYVVSAM